MKELHFSQRTKVWQGTTSQEEQNRVSHPDFCPVHALWNEGDALVLLHTLHADTYEQTSQILLPHWISSQQFVHVQWPSVWDFRRPGSWWGCQASKNPGLRVKFCFFHLNRIFGWKKKTHLWSSSNERICPTEQGDTFARGKNPKHVCREGRNHPQTWVKPLDWRLAIPVRDAPPLHVSVYYINPQWEWEALEKTKHSEHMRAHVLHTSKGEWKEQPYHLSKSEWQMKAPHLLTTLLVQIPT